MPVEFVLEAQQFQDFPGIYPENSAIVSVFYDMLTQWRVGVNGATGLAYEALPTIWGVRRIKAAERAEIFNGLQVMERAVLAELGRRKKT